MDEQVVNEQRQTLWRTSSGVVLAASTAFSLGYGASRSAHPSVGASRPPAWPLVLSIVVALVSLWFVLAPTLHRWPFDERPTGPEAGTDEHWLAELSDADQPAPAAVGTFRIEPPPGPSAEPPAPPPQPPA